MQIVVPATTTDADRGRYEQLAKDSTFNPRAHLQQEMNNAP
jgi:hypothetical protein